MLIYNYYEIHLWRIKWATHFELRMSLIRKILKPTTYRKCCLFVSDTIWKKGGFKAMHIIHYIIKVYRNKLLKVSFIALQKCQLIFLKKKSYVLWPKRNVFTKFNLQNYVYFARKKLVNWLMSFVYNFCMVEDVQTFFGSKYAD